jgi:hypothetical protein
MVAYVIMKLADQLECGDVVLMDTFPASHGDQVQAAQNRAAIMRHYVQYGFEGTFSAPVNGTEAEAPIGLYATAAAITANELNGPTKRLVAIFPQYA